MNPSDDSIEQLKAQVGDLTRKLQNLAQEKGQNLSDKTEGVMDAIKKELSRQAQAGSGTAGSGMADSGTAGSGSADSGASPFKTALAALALGLIQEFEPKVKESLKGATGKTVGFAGQIEEGFSEGLDKTVAASKKAGAGILEYVKQNPWKSLAFAAVVGLMIGRSLPRESGDAGDGVNGNQ